MEAKSDLEQLYYDKVVLELRGIYKKVIFSIYFLLFLHQIIFFAVSKKLATRGGRAFHLATCHIVDNFLYHF